MLVVRRRTDGDLQALEQIAARVRAAEDYPTFLPGDDYRRFLTRPVALEAWVSEWNARICGHVALNAQSSPGAMRVLRDAGIIGSVGAVARLLVDPDVRRRGVARALLQTARSAAVAHQRTPVLEVIESSHAAIALYRDAGWVELGRASLSLPDGRELPELVFAIEGTDHSVTTQALVTTGDVAPPSAMTPVKPSASTRRCGILRPTCDEFWLLAPSTST